MGAIGGTRGDEMLVRGSWVRGCWLQGICAGLRAQRHGARESFRNECGRRNGIGIAGGAL